MLDCCNEMLVSELGCCFWNGNSYLKISFFAADSIQAVVFADDLKHILQPDSVAGLRFGGGGGLVVPDGDVPRHPVAHRQEQLVAVVPNFDP